MFPDLNKYPRIAIDTETTGTYYPRDRAFGVSLAFPDHQSIYVDLRKHPNNARHLKEALTKYRGLKIAHNMAFDYKMLVSAGIKMDINNLDDTVIRAVQIDENHGVIYPWTRKPMSYALDDLGEYYLKERKDHSFYEKARDFFGSPAMTKNQIMARIQELPVEIVGPYAKQDALLCLRLWEWQEQEIERQGIRDICNFERSVTPTLIRAQMRGIHVDLRYAEEAKSKLDDKIDEELDKLYDIAGHKINPDSPAQVKKLFEPKQDKNGDWFACDGTMVGKTDKGQPSFKAEYLREMKHPAAKYIAEIKSLRKTSNTFLAKHVIEHEVNGKVYPTINQTAGEEGGTRTGRLSYQDPAMQQIPSRNKDVAKIVKPTFLPPPGMKWVDGDLHSFEVRVFAHLVAAYNSVVANAYAKNPEMDFHQFVADLTGLNRNAEYSGQPNAKQLNLSMIFNSGNGAIADKMGMPWEWDEFTKKDGEVIRYKRAGREALEVIALYHSRLQGVKDLAKKAKLIAEKRGYVRTGYGRRLRFRNGFKSYKASGLLIQATAADLNKENWVLTEEALGDDGFLMLNTHDSYSMAIDPNWEEPYNRVKEAIERPALRVPLVLELSGVGDNWWDALQGV